MDVNTVVLAARYVDQARRQAEQCAASAEEAAKSAESQERIADETEAKATAAPGDTTILAEARSARAAAGTARAKSADARAAADQANIAARLVEEGMLGMLRGTRSLGAGEKLLSQVAKDTNWSLVILLIFAAVLLYMVYRDNAVIQHLKDVAYARGLITFIISLAAIALAFMFAYQAFMSDNKTSEDGFRRGREVLTGLMGVLGTIVGFYFGSGDKGATGEFAMDHSVQAGTVAAHAYGGTPPYKFRLSLDAAEIKVPDLAPSKDGWMMLNFTPQDFAKANTATVEVTDANNRKLLSTFTVR